MGFTLADPKVVLQGRDEATKVFQAAMKNVESAAKSFSKIGSVLTKGVTVPVVAGGVAAVKMAVDFNSSMASIASIMPGQTARVKNMGTQIQQMAIETGIDTDTLTAGLKGVISSLGDAGDPVQKMGAAVKMSQAAMASAEDGVLLLTGVTRAYGDTTEEAFAKVADLSILTERIGDTSLGDLAHSMGRVSAASKALGVSQEEMFAVFATFTGVTGNTADNATQLSAVLNAFMKPTQKMAELAKAERYESAAAMLQNKGLAGTLELLRDKTGGNIATLGKLFTSSRALNLLIPLLGENSEEYTENLEAMKNATGATDDALKEQREGLNKAGYSFDVLKQRLKVFAQQIGDRLLPLFEKILDKVTPFVDSLLQLDDQTITKWGKFAAVAAGIGPLFLGLGKATEGIKILLSVASGLGPASTALTVLTGPLGIAAAALIAAGVACVYFRDELKPLWDVVKDFGATMRDDFVQSFKGLNGSMEGTDSHLKSLVAGLAELVAPFARVHIAITTLPLRGLIQWLGMAVNVVTRVVSVFVNFGSAIFALKNFMAEWLAVTDFPLIKALRNGLNWVLETIKPVTDYLTRVVRLLLNLPKTALKLVGFSAEGWGTVANVLNTKTAAMQFDANPANSPAYQPLGQSIAGAAQQSKIYIDFSNLPNGATVAQAGTAPVQMSSNTGPLLTGAL